MARRNRLIPFRLMPGSWGLSGNSYKIAEAEYYLDGFDLEIAKAEVESSSADELSIKKLNIQERHGKITAYDKEIALLEVGGMKTAESVLDVDYRHGKLSLFDRDMALAHLATEDQTFERELAILDVMFKHDRIEEYDYDISRAELEHDGVDLDIALLGIELDYGNISQTDHDKAKADLLEEPWIGIVDHGFDPDQGLNGVYFEFDWNSRWIEFLKLNGYVGFTDEQIVDQWFADICRSQSMNPMQEVGEDQFMAFDPRATLKR